MTTLKGVFPILNTTFKEDGSLDLPSQIRLVQYLLEAGARGFGLFANASEGYTLTRRETCELLKLIHKEVNGRVPLVVSSAHTGTDAAVERSREMEDLGASALMVLPPYYMRTDADGLMYYFAAISDAVSIPIMVQDAPLMTQVSMSSTFLARLVDEIEHVEYVKIEAPPTAPKISAVLKATDGVALFSGLNGQFIIEEFGRGTHGVMPGSDMIPQFVQLWKCLESCDRAAAWHIFIHILPLIRFELQPGLGVSAMKHNMVARGVIKSARVRHPTPSLDRPGLAELELLRNWIDCGALHATVTGPSGSS